MAVSKSDVLSYISQYAVDNKRNAPRKAIIDALGSEAGPVVDSLRKDGTIIARRGRTGGLVVADTAATPVEDTAEVSSESPAEDITAQFAMLMEKLEQDEQAASEDESETEQAVAF